jgi:hypothetical protein
MGDDAMESLVLAMMTWISAASGMPVPDRPPEIRHLPPHRLALLANPNAGGDHPAYDPVQTSGYLALYHADSRTVLLRDDWQADELRDRSILLHELVHHMQAHADRSYLCNGAMEREAYGLQAEWLEERGGDLFDTLGMNGLGLYAATRC